MIVQTIPFLVVLFFFGLNLCRKKSFLCASSLVLLYLCFSFGGAIVLYNWPRSGDSFSDLHAMLFLSACFALLLLPALFYDDRNEMSSDRLHVSAVGLRRYATFVAAITLFAFLYFSLDSVSSMLEFVRGGALRTEFREEVGEALANKSFFERIVNALNAFSLVAIFLSISLWCGFGKMQPLVFVLFLGGLSYAVSTLKMVSRGGIVEYFFFIMATTLVFSKFITRKMIREIRMFLVVAVLIALLPFLAITAKRFSGNDAESQESAFYSLSSYFCTGPYSFNADYVARTEYEMPGFNGMLTMPWLPMVKDKLLGTTLAEEGQELIDEFWKQTAPEYTMISGAISGEFKTIVGSFLCDFKHGGVIFVCLIISLVFSGAFVALRGRLSGLMFGTIYFYILLMAPIGYAFAQRHKNIMLLVLILTTLYFIFAEQHYQERNE